MKENGPPYVAKDKGFTRSNQLPIDTKFIVPNKTTVSFESFLKVMLKSPNIDIIKREIYPDKAANQKRNSDSLQGALEINFKNGAARCRSDTACLLRIFEMVVTAKNLFGILKNLNVLVDVLFTNSANSDASFRVQIRNVILKKAWGNEVLLDRVKNEGVFSISRTKK